MRTLIATKRSRPLAKPSALEPREEAAALEFLRKNRGRAIYEPTKQVSQLASKIVGAPKNQNATKLHYLKLNWREIVGENLANICLPDAIRGKTLVLRANSAAAPLLQMRAKEILGLAALSCGIHFAKIGFIHAPLVKRPIAQKPKPIDADAAQRLEQKLLKVQSKGLKKELRLFNMSIQNKS